MRQRRKRLGLNRARMKVPEGRGQLQAGICRHPSSVNFRYLMCPNLSRLLSALTILALPALAAAQEEDLSTIPWAYSTYFGTGWYKVGEDRDAFAIRYAPRKPLREAVL